MQGAGKKKVLQKEEEGANPHSGNLSSVIRNGGHQKGKGFAILGVEKKGNWVYEGSKKNKKQRRRMKRKKKEQGTKSDKIKGHLGGGVLLISA